MATGKYKKKNRGADDINRGGRIHNVVVRMGDDTNKNESDVPWSLLIAVVVLCFVLVIALPVMGIMYMDMNNATAAAMEEVKKMRELRAKILMQMQGE
jgi:hypothetical protein